MVRKPSDRTNRQKPLQGLDLTPFIDMIMSIMFFLLIFAALIPVVIIDAPLPKVASTAEEIRKAKKMKERFDITVWITEAGYTIKAGSFKRNLNKKDKDKYPTENLHNLLVRLKSSNPDAREITLVPADSITYNVMIQTMDTARSLLEGDPGYKPIPPEIATKPESLKFNRLFPDVTIGGV